MDGQQSLTLCWRSFSWWGREHFTLSFAYKGSQYLVYDYLQPITPQITQDTCPWIVDAPLTLISMMGQGALYFPVCLEMQLILRLWLFATYRPPEYPRYMTKNCWCSVDADFHDGPGSVSRSLWPIKAANTSLMTICNLSPARLTKIYDQESLTLRWRSFSWWGRQCFTFSFAYNGSQYFVYDYLQPIATQITHDTWPRIAEAPLTLILPREYPQYAIIWLGIVHHWRWFGSLSSVLIYFLLDHYIVL